MKNSLTLSLALLSTLVLSACASTSNSSGDAVVLELVNATGTELQELYVSHVSEDSWDEDYLAGRTLANGESIQVPLMAENSPLYDILTADTQGFAFTRWEANATLGQVQLSTGDLDPNYGPAFSRTIEGEGGDYSGSFELYNSTGKDIYYVLVSHVSDDYWGDDLLGDNTILPEGYSMIINVNNFPSSMFDVQVLDQEQVPYSAYNLDADEYDADMSEPDAPEA